MIRNLKRNRGASLIEVLLGTIIVVTMVFGMAVIVPKLIASITHRAGRATALTVASSEAQRMSVTPYHSIQLTSAAAFPPGNTCDCTKLDQTQWDNLTYFPVQIVNSPQGTFTQRMCVNLVANGAAVCPPGSPDPGLKMVMMNVSRQADSTPQFSQTQTLVSRNEQAGDVLQGAVEINFCIGNPGDVACPSSPTWTDRS